MSEEEQEFPDDLEDDVRDILDGNVKPHIESLGDSPEGLGRYGIDWNSNIPIWDPNSPTNGILAHGDAYTDDGLFIIVSGHVGSGKTLATINCCPAFAQFIDRVDLVSTTEIKTKAFTGNSNIVPRQYVTREPNVSKEENDKRKKEKKPLKLDWLDRLALERTGHMEEVGRNSEMRQKSKLVIMDDVAHCQKLMVRKTDAMIGLITRRRQLRLYMMALVQSIGYLGKFMREQADYVILARESLASLIEALWMVYYKGKITLEGFRDMMDQICITGRQVLVLNVRHGGTYRMPLKRDIRLEKPIGNRQMREWAEMRAKKEDDLWKHQGERKVIKGRS